MTLDQRPERILADQRPSVQELIQQFLVRQLRGT